MRTGRVEVVEVTVASAEVNCDFHRSVIRVFHLKKFCYRQVAEVVVTVDAVVVLLVPARQHTSWHTSQNLPDISQIATGYIDMMIKCLKWNCTVLVCQKSIKVLCKEDLSTLKCMSMGEKKDRSCFQLNPGACDCCGWDSGRRKRGSGNGRHCQRCTWHGKMGLWRQALLLHNFRSWSQLWVLLIFEAKLRAEILPSAAKSAIKNKADLM